MLITCESGWACNRLNSSRLAVPHSYLHLIHNPSQLSKPPDRLQRASLDRRPGTHLRGTRHHGRHSRRPAFPRRTGLGGPLRLAPRHATLSHELPHRAPRMPRGHRDQRYVFLSPPLLAVRMLATHALPTSLCVARNDGRYVTGNTLRRANLQAAFPVSSSSLPPPPPLAS